MRRAALAVAMLVAATSVVALPQKGQRLHKSSKSDKRAGSHAKKKAPKVQMPLRLDVAPPVACTAPNTQPPVSDLCRHTVQAAHSERLAPVETILALLAFAGRKHGFELAHPWTGGGSLVAAGQVNGVPLSSYIATTGVDRCDATDRAVVKLVMVRDRTVKPGHPRWCRTGGNDTEAELCVHDWSVCNSREAREEKEAKNRKMPLAWECPAYPDDRYNVTLHLGGELAAAFRTLERDCVRSTGSWWSIATTRSNYATVPPTLLMPRKNQRWYSHFKYETVGEKGRAGTIPLQVFAGVAPQLVEAATRIANLHLRCPAGQELSAILRLVHLFEYKKPADIMYEYCAKKLMWINQRSRDLFGPTQPCRHLLASDWFVKADGNLPKQHNLAMTSCFRNMMEGENGNTSATREWYHVEKHHARRAGASLPLLERAMAVDFNGYMAYLDVAMLVRADTCVQKSHMSAVASRIRTLTGKQSCETVDLRDLRDQFKPMWWASNQIKK